MFNLLSGEYSVFRIARADFPATAPHSVFFLPFFARTAILGKTTKVRTIMMRKKYLCAALQFFEAKKEGRSTL